ncbi:YggT family protein [Candidatus Enterococcus huntleyi]|uniref:YggT family protein n=1 Tax=Candidatus Enterococcus huntleyi TaxID=1857217 RepID=UPI00137B5513|nr:YggT family protein [Enterococcus sp. JM4C]
MIYLLLKGVELYSLLLVIYALLSWFPGGYQSPFGKLLARLCEPYLSLFDRLNLHFGPIDFTIMAAILLLNFASRGLVILIGTFL